MRYAIFSDVHAYPPALEKVLADAESQRADVNICLGDVVGYGPDPVGAVSLCRAACDAVVAGNHDAAVAQRIDARAFIARAQEAVNWHRSKLSKADIEWLEGLPMSDVREDFVAVHGELHQRDGRLAAGFGYVLEAFGADTVFAACGQLWLSSSPSEESSSSPVSFMATGRKPLTYTQHLTSNPNEIVSFYDSGTGSISFRHLPFDFRGYAEAMDAQGVEPPVWVADHLRTNG